MNKCPICGKPYIKKSLCTSPNGYKSVTYVHTIKPFGSKTFHITVYDGCSRSLEK